MFYICATDVVHVHFIYIYTYVANHKSLWYTDTCMHVHTCVFNVVLVQYVANHKSLCYTDTCMHVHTCVFRVQYVANHKRFCCTKRIHEKDNEANAYTQIRRGVFTEENVSCINNSR